MSRPFVFSSDKPALVVPDIHQNLDYLARVVELAARAGAVLVFLGDYVDGVGPRWQDPAALRALAQALPEIADSHVPGCVFLPGNHDVQAIKIGRHRATLLIAGEEEQVEKLDHAMPAAVGYGILLGAWSKDFLLTWHLSAVVHGYLATHAGVARRHWPWSVGTDPEDQIDAFYAETQAAWVRFVRTSEMSALFDAGPGRGGKNAPVGGPLWLDWDTEFVDDLPLPQVVGHTRGREARRKDRSWCLDAGQTCAALLDPDLGLRLVRIS